MAKDICESLGAASAGLRQFEENFDEVIAGLAAMPEYKKASPETRAAIDRAAQELKTFGPVIAKMNNLSRMIHEFRLMAADD